MEVYSHRIILCSRCRRQTLHRVVFCYYEGKLERIVYTCQVCHKKGERKEYD